MSAFNKTTTGTRQPKAVSKDGVKAFSKDAYQELCDRVLTCFWGQDSFYEKGSQGTARIKQLLGQIAAEDPVFIAKLAVLSRERFNLRSVTQVLTAELSRNHRGDDLISRVVQRVAIRPDDLTEMLAYLINDTAKVVTIGQRTEHRNKRLPNGIRRAMAKAFAKFDEYQLAKYAADKKEVSLADLVMLCRPKPTSEDQRLLWKRVLENKLAAPETWERALSEAGSKTSGKTEAEKAKAKREAWETQVANRKLGYMAALRNIRNLIEAGVSPETHKMVQDYLGNEKAVLGGKQLPFRYWSACKEIEKITADPFVRKGYIAALNKALSYSGANINRLPGRTVLGIDLSGSMDCALSNKSDITRMEVGALLGALAPRFCDESITTAFGQTFAVVNVSEKVDDVLGDVQRIVQTNVGHSTNGYLIFDYLLKNKLSVDRVLVFTDEQMNGARDFMSSVAVYRKFSPNTEVVVINLAGYGTTQIDPQDPRNVYMAGWSDQSLEFLTRYKELKNGIVDIVNDVEL